MAATFIVRHPHQNEHSIGTVKALYPKIVSSPAPSISNLFTLLRDGRVLHPMHGYTMMLARKIYISQTGNIIWRMQDFPCANNCSLPTMGHSIILLNGAAPVSGIIFCIFGIIYLYCNYRPLNKEELFNLRHASLRNVIEHIFGVLKRRFRILLLPPEYSLAIQARIPVAISAIHNFIRAHEPGEEPQQGNPDIHHDVNDHSNEDPVAGIVEREEVDVQHDKIAQDMWDDYL